MTAATTGHEPGAEAAVIARRAQRLGTMKNGKLTVKQTV